MSSGVFLAGTGLALWTSNLGRGCVPDIVANYVISTLVFTTFYGQQRTLYQLSLPRIQYQRYSTQWLEVSYGDKKHIQCGRKYPSGYRAKRGFSPWSMCECLTVSNTRVAACPTTNGVLQAWHGHQWSQWWPQTAPITRINIHQLFVCCRINNCQVPIWLYIDFYTQAKFIIFKYNFCH